MRKGFNFYRSYYDVANELNDSDKLKFLWALIQKQFEGIDTELTGMAKFAYLSQKFNIDTQVLGYENKTKTKITPSQGGTVGGSQGGTVGGSVQEKEKEEGKEKEKEQLVKQAQTLLTVNFLKWFNEMKFKHKGIKGNFKTLTKTDISNLKELKKANYTPEDFEHAYKIMIDTEWVKINKIDTPTHFLVNTNFSKYVNTVVTNESKFNPYG
jgi:hypothetical protein